MELEFTHGTDILAINGKEHSDGSLFSGDNQLRLANGRHQLAVRYTAEIETSADEYELEKSDVFVLVFTAEDSKLQLSTPAIDSSYDLKKFNRNKNWKLTDAQGNSVDYKISVLEKEGFQLGRDYEEELAVFNRSQAPAAISGLTHTGEHAAPTGYSSAQTFSAPVPATNTANNDQKMAAEMLKYWYQQADKSTRNNFKNWINTSQK